MLLGMFAAAIGRIVEEGRRPPLAKGPIIANVDPEPASSGLPLGQHRHGRVIPMQTFGAEHVLADQLVQGRQHRGRRADQIGEGRQVEVDAFSGVTLALAVERLVLPILLEEDHGQKAGADPPARDDVEGCWRLADPLAIPAAELLAHGLPDEPAARDHIERLGHRLADLR
jgi:hypothetical protein